MSTALADEYWNYVLLLRNAPASVYLGAFSYRLWSLRTVGCGRTRGNSELAGVKLCCYLLFLLTTTALALHFEFYQAPLLPLHPNTTLFFLPQILAAALCFSLTLKEFKNRIQEAS